MADNKGSTPTGNKHQTREDRLKAALKANLARRKAQLRVRAQGADPEVRAPEKLGKDKDA